MINRPGQFNYQDAIKDDLPIGSGEIESAHSYVIQARLKLSGCWCQLENAMTMLALRVLRANRDWDSYWVIVHIPLPKKRSLAMRLISPHQASKIS